MKNSKKIGKIGIIIFGPQGSGKGTQAELLADRFGLFHFNAGDYLRRIIYDPKLQKNKIVKRERKLHEAGKLNTTSWVVKIFSQRFKELINLGQSIITEGSPRTVLEAFGDKKIKGIINIFKKGYGKRNIFVFILNIPEKESIKRNIKRLTCSVCKITLLSPDVLRQHGQTGNLKFKICPFCGGKVMHRKDDNKAVLLTRLKEYRERTQPIFKELKKRGYKIYKIDGTPMPYKIHQKIVSYLPR